MVVLLSSELNKKQMRQSRRGFGFLQMLPFFVAELRSKPDNRILRILVVSKNIWGQKQMDRN